jgi:hypothetical protein
VHSIEDVKVVKSFAIPIQIPMRCRINDVPGTNPDFADFSSKGRPGSRDQLIEALSTKIRGMLGATDHAVAYNLVAEIDGGILRRDDVRSSTDQAAWAALASDPERQPFTGWMAPGLRLVGSTSTKTLSSALLEWTQDVGGSSPIKAPVFWLPPNLPHWGRSVQFATLAAALSDANEAEDGTVLLARVDGPTQATRWLQRLYGPSNKLEALFDRCFTLIRPDIPDALELIVKPNAWALALIHAPDQQTNYPFPFGYILAEPGIVARYIRRFAELAALGGPDKLIWHRPDENADKALAMIDQALGIEVAE